MNLGDAFQSLSYWTWLKRVLLLVSPLLSLSKVHLKYHSSHCEDKVNKITTVTSQTEIIAQWRIQKKTGNYRKQNSLPFHFMTLFKQEFIFFLSHFHHNIFCWMLFVLNIAVPQALCLGPLSALPVPYRWSHQTSCTFDVPVMTILLIWKPVSQEFARHFHLRVPLALQTQHVQSWTH